MLMHDGADVDAWVGGLVLGGEFQCRPAAWAGRAPAGATTPAGVDGAFALFFFFFFFFFSAFWLVASAWSVRGRGPGESICFAARL